MYVTLVEFAFRQDVVQGLSALQKSLSSKYFYDAAGDQLLPQIMASPEYYLTQAEAQLLQHQSAAIVRACAAWHPKFDIVKLGAGDAFKTVCLLQEAVAQSASQRYFPIDISPSTIDYV